MTAQMEPPPYGLSTLPKPTRVAVEGGSTLVERALQAELPVFEPNSLAHFMAETVTNRQRERYAQLRIPYIQAAWATIIAGIIALVGLAIHSALVAVAVVITGLSAILLLCICGINIAYYRDVYGKNTEIRWGVIDYPDWGVRYIPEPIVERIRYAMEVFPKAKVRIHHFLRDPLVELIEGNESCFIGAWNEPETFRELQRELH